MKQTRILTIAALFAMGAIVLGCNKVQTEEETAPVQEQDNIVTLNISVGFSPETKALTEAGVKTFNASEEIAVVYENESSALVKTSHTIADGELSNGNKILSFSVDMTNPKSGGTLHIIYPASMAGENDVDYTKLGTQDGTLATLSANLDLGYYDGTLDGASLRADAQLSNPLALLKFTAITCGSSSKADIRQLVITANEKTYIVNRTPADTDIWVAVEPSDTEISIKAAVGKDLYAKTVSSSSNTTLAGGHIVPVSLTMNQVPGVLSGLFSVSATEKVRFSKGNLQAKIETYASDVATASEWKFADNQYDYIGNAAGNTSFATKSWVDLFSWVGTSADKDTYGLITFTKNSKANHGDQTTDALKTDWGTAAVSNIGSGWRTLTKDEWNYYRQKFPSLLQGYGGR